MKILTILLTLIFSSSAFAECCYWGRHSHRHNNLNELRYQYDRMWYNGDNLFSPNYRRSHTTVIFAEPQQPKEIHYYMDSGQQKPTTVNVIVVDSVEEAERLFQQQAQ